MRIAAKPRGAAVALATLLLWAGAMVLAQESQIGPVELSYRIAVDQPLRYRLDYSGRGSYTKQEEPESPAHPMTVDFKSRLILKTTPRQDGDLSATIRFEGFSHRVGIDQNEVRLLVGPGILRKMRGEEVVFDISQKRFLQSPVAQRYLALQKPLSFVLEKKGRIGRFEGARDFDLLLPRLALKEALTLHAVRLPDGAVGQGESWTADYPVPLPDPEDGSLKIQVVHTFVDRTLFSGYNCAVIRMEGELAHEAHLPNSSDAWENVYGAQQQTLACRQKISGEVFFAAAEGFPVQSDLRIETDHRAVVHWKDREYSHRTETTATSMTIQSSLTYRAKRN